MSAINPELLVEQTDHPWPGLRKNDPAFKHAVGRLFARSEGVIVRAVDEFLAKGPGALDHHGLRLIAAAGRHFDDANHVAHMIRSLPLTKMEVALARLDLDQTSEKFGTVVPRFRPTTSRKLVLDLVRQGAIQVLENSPPDRVPEEGRALIRLRLAAKMKGTAYDQRHALESPFVSAALVVEALRRTEEMIDQFFEHEVDSDNANRSYLRIDDLLGSVLDDRVSSVLTDDQLSRAWRQARRFVESTTYRPTSTIDAVVNNRRLLASEGQSILDSFAVKASSKVWDNEAMYARGVMLAASELSEEAARSAVRAGVTGDLRGDLRLYLLRATRYFVSNSLLEPMSNSEIDAVLVQASPPEEWDATWLTLVEDPSILTHISNSAGVLEHRSLGALLQNPNLEAGHVSTIIDHLDGPRLRGPDRSMSWDVQALLMSRSVDDTSLARMIDIMQPESIDDDDGLRRVLRLAALNRSSGRQVLERIDAHGAGRSNWKHRLICDIASRTASSSMQEALLSQASADDDPLLAGCLAKNCMIRRDTWDRLIERFPDARKEIPSMMPKLYLALGVPCPYDHRDVLQLVLSDDAPDNRVPLLLEEMLRVGGPSVAAEMAQLTATGHVDKRHLIEGTTNPDLHDALIYATDPHLRDEVGEFVGVDVKKLTVTAEVIAAGNAALPEDRGLNSWDQLPDEQDRPLPETSLHRLLNGREVEGLRLEFPRTRGEVVGLSKEMRNCLDGYVEEIFQGKKIVAFVRDEDDIYAVLWKIARGIPGSAGMRDDALVEELGSDGSGRFRIEIREMNSRFNAGRVPVSVRVRLGQLTDQFNEGALEPVVVADRESVDPETRKEPSTAVELSGGTSDASTPRVRPPRRVAVHLASHVDGTDGGREPDPPVVGPSLLAGFDVHAPDLDDSATAERPSTVADPAPTSRDENDADLRIDTPRDDHGTTLI